MNIAEWGMTMLSANRSVTGRRRGLARRTHWVAALTAFGIVGAALPHAHAQTTLYAIDAGGKLLWNQHLGSGEGSAKWASNAARSVGAGWSGFAGVFAGANDSVYVVRENGDLAQYAHTGRAAGTGSWNGPKVVGTGWLDAKWLFAGPNGIVYVIKPNGDLRWYKHTGQSNLTQAWQGGHAVGSGWGQFDLVVAAANGVIYARKPSGELLWYKHTGQAGGTSSWGAGSGRVVGSGWSRFTHVAAGPQGVLYGLTGNGALHWYRHLGAADGSMRWAVPQVVASGVRYTNLFSPPPDGGETTAVGDASSGDSKEAPPPITLSAAELESYKKDPLGALLPKFLASPAAKGPLDAAFSRVKVADAKLTEAIEKLATLARDGTGVLGQWKTKQLCVPKKVTVKGSCKAYAQECSGWGVPRCSSRCARWGRVLKFICEKYESFDCTSPCNGWRNTSTCLVWWPDDVRSEDACSDVRYFDPTEGSIYKDARREAEKRLAEAKAALEKLGRDLKEKAQGILAELTRRIEGFIRNPPGLFDLLNPLPNLLQTMFGTIFEIIGEGAMKLVAPIFQKSASSGKASMSFVHAWLERRQPAPLCRDTSNDSVKQIRSGMALGATGALLIAAKKLKETLVKFSQNAKLMAWNFNKGEVTARAKFNRLWTKFTGTPARLKDFVNTKVMYLKADLYGKVFGTSAPKASVNWKEAFKKAAKKGALPMALVAIQWGAVAAAGPFAHGQCDALLDRTEKGMAAYRSCFTEHYLVWSRATFFDAMVGTAVGALDPTLITPVAMSLSGAFAAAMTAAFPPSATQIITAAAILGIVLKIAATVGLTAAADTLIPWYLKTYWPAEGTGESNVKKFFAEQAEGAAKTFPKTWYSSKYYVDETKNGAGKYRCGADTDCTGERACKGNYCSHDEAKNPLGKNRCSDDIDCAAPRYCEAPGGRKGSNARHCQDRK